MIICSCNIVSDSKVKQCLKQVENPTVGAVFKALDVDPKCARCVRTIVNLIREHSNQSIEIQNDFEI